MVEDNSSGYHDLPEGANQARWQQQKEDYDDTALVIEGHPVMEAWEAPYMHEFAALVTRNKGRVLECGFGMGLSATAIQSFGPDEHVIIEANADVFKRLQTFQQEASHKVTPVLGLAADAVSSFESASFDGIFYDTYPLNAEQQHIHQFAFIKNAYPLLKAGGILTYCNLTSTGVLKNDYDNWEDLFRETQLPHLLDAGISEHEVKGLTIVKVDPPASCQYFQHATAMVPIIVKGH